MKSKRIGSIVLLAFIILNLMGCKADPVKKDLMNYINKEIPTIAELEKEVTVGYANVSGDKYTDDETMYYAIRDEVMPASTELIAAAEAIEVETKEVRLIHEKYIAAMNDQNSAFSIILSALENQDYEQIASANDKLTLAREGVRTYLAEIKALAKEYDLEFNGSFGESL